jgi:PAS domain S-box-containing protein
MAQAGRRVDRPHPLDGAPSPVVAGGDSAGLRRSEAVRRNRPRLATAHLKESGARHQDLNEQIPTGIFLLNSRSLRILDTNAAASKLTGYSQEELLGMRLPELVPEASRVAAAAQLATVTADGLRIPEAKCQHKNGSIVDLEVEQRRLGDGRILSVFRDTSQQVRAEGHLHEMLSGIALFAATVDADGKISYANPVLSALTGWSVDELIGCSIYELLSPGTEGSGAAELGRRLRNASLQNPLITKIVTRSGENRLVAISATLLQGRAGEPSQAAILGHDVTEERALHILLERELRERRDVAAGIGRLDLGGTAAATAHAICRELRSLREVDLAILFVFDAEGDATVLAIDAPENFFLSVGVKLPSARAGYLIERASHGPWAEHWRERPEDGLYGKAMTASGVQSLSYAPIRYGPSTLGVVGVGAFGGADQAAMVAHLPTLAEFGAAASALLALDLQAERIASRRRLDLAKIIHTHAYAPLFQPIVEVTSGQIWGYEALTRFLDGERPDGRLSTAWSIGMGTELELALLATTIEAGRQLPDGRCLNVNVSPRLLDDPGPVREILAKADRPVVVEITEHQVITDYPAFRVALSRLGAVRIAVDDAGAGIANFAHILELRPDFVKLDIDLVRGIDTNPARQAMAAAMCHFTRSTGGRLIAEGVETRGEANTVQALGVDLGQGYWYGRPQPVQALITGPSPSPTRATSASTPKLALVSAAGEGDQGGD